MPDIYGFNHLGEERRCIEDGCGFGGPVYTLTNRQMKRHHEQHVRDRAKAAQKRQRDGLRHAQAMRRLQIRENRMARQLNGGV